MKKIMFFLSLFITTNIYALELNYSDWSLDYPNVNEILIESEVRYKYYTLEEYDINYVEQDNIKGDTLVNYKDYIVEGNKVLYKTYKTKKNYLDGYYKNNPNIKDENDYKTYYRYITNDYVVVNEKGSVVKSDDYCVKEICMLLYIEPKKSIEENVLETEEIIEPN